MVALLPLSPTARKPPPSPPTPTFPRGSSRLLMSALVKRLVACLVIIVCAVWYARSHFYRDPGSAFFDSSRAYDRRYSTHRLAEIEHFIDSSAYEDLGKASPNATLCVAFTSVKRSQAQYLETSIASLLEGLTQKERAALHLSVLIAETDPSKHPSWNHPWVREAVDDFYTYEVGPDERNWLQLMEEGRDYRRKGVYDYIYALEKCHETGAPYIGMFEDDIMMSDGWLARTLLGLRGLPQSITVEGDEEEDAQHKPWLFVRLFNQERSTGWAKHHIGGNHEFWICLAVGSVILAVSSVARWGSRTARTYLDPATVGVLVLVLNPALVVLFFQSGKASLLPPSPGVFQESFGCCSQALVFPRVQIPSLTDYLQERGRGQVDLLVKHRARDFGLARYSLYPVPAQHIGLESARKTNKDEAQAIWSMAYEDLDPVALDREHHDMVDEYDRMYGWI